MNNDLISRKWLTDAIRNRKTYLSYEDAKDVIDLINNAPTIDIKDELAGAYNEGYMCGNKEAEKARPQGEWVDHSEEGYVECPFCEHLTTCEDNIDELHYCWNCGAKLRKGGVNE